MMIVSRLLKDPAATVKIDIDQGTIIKTEGEKYLTREDIIRPLSKFRVRRFSGLFWPLFDFFCGDHIERDMIPAKKSRKSAQKNQKIDRT